MPRREQLSIGWLKQREFLGWDFLHPLYDINFLIASLKLKASTFDIPWLKQVLEAC